MTGRAPAVSIVVPTYQRRPWVVRAVRSILAQTWRDFEAIVVDDGSRDGTGEALAELEGPIRYLWQPNRGASAARNAGIEAARGEILAFLDSDCVWLPDHLAVVLRALREHPRAVLACTTPFYRLGWRLRSGRGHLVFPFPDILVRTIAGYVSSTAVRRRELEAVGGFDERLVTAEDDDLWRRLAVRGPFALVRRRTVGIELLPDSLSVRTRGLRRRATRLSLERLEEDLRRADRGAEAERLRGLRSFGDALDALARDDERVARERLGDACRGLPELSAEPGQALFSLSRLPDAGVPAVRLHRLELVATGWPDRESDLALAFRLRAIGAALRLGRLRRAGSLLAGTPLLPLVRFLAGWPVRSLRWRLVWLGHLRREPTDLGPRGDVGHDDGPRGHQR